MLKHRAVTQSRSQMLKHRAVTQSRSQMLKHRAVTQSRVADAETQRLHSPESQMLKHRGSRYQPGPTMLKHKGSRYSQRSTSTNHRSYTRMLTQSRAQFTWLKQPANCDAETTSATTRRSCYSSRNNNTSFSSCNSILLRETRTSYSGLESRSD
jgi:hypothetical protein